MFRLPDIHKEGEIEERVGIVLKNNLYPEDGVKQILNFIYGREIPTKGDIKKIKKDFKSDEYGFDNMYRFKMFLANFLINCDRLSDEEILKLSERDLSTLFLEDREIFRHDKTSYGKKLKAFGKDIPDQRTLFHKDLIISDKKKWLKSIGVPLRDQTKISIENRLALLELFTMVSLKDLTPELLKVCPRYLESPDIAKMASTYGFMSKEGSKEDTKGLNKLTSSLKDKRTSTNKKILRDWKIYSCYVRLKEEIELLNKIKINRPEEHEIYRKTIERNFQLGKMESNRLKNKISSVDDFIFDILKSKRLIGKEHTFNSLKTRMRKILKKHGDGTIILFLTEHIDLITAQTPFILENPVLWEWFD